MSEKKKGNRNFLTLSLTFCPPAQMFSDLFQVFNKYLQEFYVKEFA